MDPPDNYQTTYDSNTKLVVFYSLIASIYFTCKKLIRDNLKLLDLMLQLSDDCHDLLLNALVVIISPLSSAFINTIISSANILKLSCELLYIW